MYLVEMSKTGVQDATENTVYYRSHSTGIHLPRPSASAVCYMTSVACGHL